MTPYRPFFLYLLALILAAWPLSAPAADSPKRLALVVGNAAYPGSPLENPVNDARAIAISLKELGFNVTALANLSQREFNRAITIFGEQLTPNTVALFYYAGHGMQVRGKNYLIPVDAQIHTEAGVKSEAVDVDTLLEHFQSAGSPLNIVILDACRNNPFERRFRSTVGAGLAQMDAPKGTLVAYATAPGKTALDGEGANGVYTTELLRAVRHPGLKVEDVFKQVRIRVAALTADQQMPWEASSLTGDFYFTHPDAVAVVGTSPAAEVEATAVAPPVGRGALTKLRGIVSPEKEAFLSDPQVQARLRQLGMDIEFEVVPSREITARIDPKIHDFAFVASATQARRLKTIGGARATVHSPFHSVLAVASWQPVAEMLAANGMASRQSGGAYFLDLKRLLEAMRNDMRWKDLKNNTALPLNHGIQVHSADARLSSSAALYLALLGYVSNNFREIGSEAEIGAALPGLLKHFAEQGVEEGSSVGLFDDYLQMGMGAYPLVALEEAQFIGHFAQGAPPGEKLLLYPVPTLFTKHSWVAFNGHSEKQGKLLRDDGELQRLAAHHGFRTAQGDVTTQWRERGITAPAQILEVANPPAWEILERMLTLLEQRLGCASSDKGCENHAE